MTDRAEYLPVDGTSFGVDDTAESLLSQDEKGYVYEGRRTRKRYHSALKAVVILLVLILHASLIVFLARWLLPTASGASTNMGPNITNMPDIGEVSGTGKCIMRDTYDKQHTIEGTPRDDYKNPDAEFLQVNPCGSTAAEARARGCRFGMLYGAWLPEECYDEESEENFKKHTGWRFWLQPNRTEELTWDEVAKGEHDYVLVEWEYHQRHCAEMNRRFFTAVTRRGLHTIDSYLSQWRHMDHCSHAAMIQKPYHELGGLLWRKFPDCGVIRWKN